MTGVEHVFGDLRQMRSGDHQHLRTMLGERARRHGPCQDARQVEHANTGER